MNPNSWIFYGYNWSQKSIIESFLYSRDVSFRTIVQVHPTQKLEAILCPNVSQWVSDECLEKKILNSTHLDSYICFENGGYKLIEGDRTTPLTQSESLDQIPDFYFIIFDTPLLLKKETNYNYVIEKNSIKVGQKLEIFNGTKWIESIVEDPEKDWSQLYHPLSKYKKVRVMV